MVVSFSMKFQEYAVTKVKMCLLGLTVLKHALYELQNTTGQKQQLKDIEKIFFFKHVEGDIEKKKITFSPSAKLL